MLPLHAFDDDLSRLETNRQFVAGLLEQVPELQAHAIVTDALGEQAGRSPTETARQLIDGAFMMDGISNAARQRILGLMQALPAAYTRLPKNTRSQVDTLLLAYRRRLQQKAWVPCCLLNVVHRRTLAVSNAISRTREHIIDQHAQGKLLQSIQPVKPVMPQSRPQSQPQPQPHPHPLLKPISWQPDGEGQLDWHAADRPILKAPPPSPCGSDAAPLEPATGEGVIRLVPPPEAVRQAHIAQLETGVRQLEAELDLILQRMRELELDNPVPKHAPAVAYGAFNQTIQFRKQQLRREQELRPYRELSRRLESSIAAMREQIANAVQLPKGHLFSPDEEKQLRST